MVDGNFANVHRKSAGKVSNQPRMMDTVFINKETVDKLVKPYKEDLVPKDMNDQVSLEKSNIVHTNSEFAIMYL